uniref:Uncharacterized protein n=2 Tax=Opuntia streptacantha TaxID=393608 RepID=A0A7C8Z2U4_OPUST
MTRMDRRRKRKATVVDEESSSGGASSGDRIRGEARSNNREDTALQQRATLVEGGKGPGDDFEDVMGDYVIRHRCAFEAICGLVEDLNDAQKDSIRGTVWRPVLEYKKFPMDRHMVRAFLA